MDLKTVIDSTPMLKKPRRTFTAEFKHQLIQQCQQRDERTGYLQVHCAVVNELQTS